MNHYNIEILKSDFTYVLEAIRMRGHALADQIASQALRAEQAVAKAEAEANQWTVTTEGDSIVAVNKATKQKRKADAPYGYKKDGTPKKRPGRPGTGANK